MEKLTIFKIHDTMHSMKSYHRLVSCLPKPKTNIFIYALKDPSSKEVMYIGMTTRGLQRFEDHYKSCYCESKYMTSVKKWIRNLKKEKTIFEIEYLEYFSEDGQHVDIAEQRWIKYFIDRGIKLLNHEMGGRSTGGCKALVDASNNLRRDKMNEYWSHPENRKKLSERVKLGQSKPGVKERMIESAKSRKFSDLFNEKKTEYTNSIKCIISDDQGNTFIGLTEAAKFYNVNNSTIDKAIKGLIYLVKGHKLTKISGGTGKQSIQTPYIKKGRQQILNQIIDSNQTIYINATDASNRLNIKKRQVFRLLSKECKSTKEGISLEYYKGDTCHL